MLTSKALAQLGIALVANIGGQLPDLLAPEPHCRIGIINIPTPFGFRLKCNRISLIITVTVFVTLMNPQFVKDGPEANKWLSAGTISWTSEVYFSFSLYDA